MSRVSPATGFIDVDEMRPDALDECSDVTEPDRFRRTSTGMRSDTPESVAIGAARLGAAATILSSSALRSGEPGGGGGFVRCFARGGGGSAAGLGVASDAGAGFGVCAGTAGPGGSLASPSSDQPEARSAIRFFVSSPRRRRGRSSSGTDKR